MKKQHICYCVDKGFEKYALASIISLFMNSKIKNPIIHIIHNKFTDKKKLKLAEKLFKKKFKYYLTDDSLFYGLPVLGGYSAYYRLLVPDLLSKKISTALYLDCDTIIEDDISSIFSFNLEKHALAAVEDVVMIKSDFKSVKKRLKIPQKNSYFNSGVILMNLDFMRRISSSKKVINYLKKNIKNIVMHDQDGLNGVFYDKWIKLPEEYNYVISFDLFHSKLKKPKIIHFAGFKPEMVKVINPGNYYSKKYFEYLDMVNFPKDELKKEDVIKFFKRAYKALFETGFFF